MVGPRLVHALCVVALLAAAALAAAPVEANCPEVFNDCEEQVAHCVPLPGTAAGGVEETIVTATAVAGPFQLGGTLKLDNGSAAATPGQNGTVRLQLLWGLDPYPANFTVVLEKGLGATWGSGVNGTYSFSFFYDPATYDFQNRTPTLEGQFNFTVDANTSSGYFVLPFTLKVEDANGSARDGTGYLIMKAIAPQGQEDGEESGLADWVWPAIGGLVAGAALTVLLRPRRKV